jgi:hypothetical protein
MVATSGLPRLRDGVREKRWDPLVRNCGGTHIRMKPGTTDGIKHEVEL